MSEVGRSHAVAEKVIKLFPDYDMGPEHPGEWGAKCTNCGKRFHLHYLPPKGHFEREICCWCRQFIQIEECAGRGFPPIKRKVGLLSLSDWQEERRRKKVLSLKWDIVYGLAEACVAVDANRKAP